jgi:hypothetical protein
MHRGAGRKKHGKAERGEGGFLLGKRKDGIQIQKVYALHAKSV